MTLLTDLRDRAGLVQQLATDPAPINGYDLSIDERKALLAHDHEALRARGVPDDLLRVADMIARPAS